MRGVAGFIVDKQGHYHNLAHIETITIRLRETMQDFEARAWSADEPGSSSPLGTFESHAEAVASVEEALWAARQPA